MFRANCIILLSVNTINYLFFTGYFCLYTLKQSSKSYFYFDFPIK